MNNEYLKLCLVTHIKNQSLPEYKAFLTQAVLGGVTSVQLRLKGYTPEDFLLWASQIKAHLDPFNIPLLINDNVEIANKINALGVHLGQSDVSPRDARDILGPHKIVGLSIETREELDAANRLTCIDYVAASAVFKSKTKTNCKTIWGISGLKEMVKLSKHPVVAIGGIDEKNVKEVVETKVSGIALVSAIHDAPDPKEAAKKLRGILR